MVFVTFEKKPSARTGNILFQYLFTKVISLEFGHQYIPWEEFPREENQQTMTLYESLHDQENVHNLLRGNIENVREKNIICSGYFQETFMYFVRREKLIPFLFSPASLEDYWFGVNGEKQFIRDFLLSTTHSIPDLSIRDVVISLRLDDFQAANDPTSNIIPPEYYGEILENLEGKFDRLFIVCDTLRHDWEHRYIAFFDKWKPILLQKDLLHDFALIRDAPVLLHSNSTFCWMASFLSSLQKKRFIPNTKFYQIQKLHKIEETDVLDYISPLYHNQVYALNKETYLMKYIYPLSYCIPDECIVDFEQVARQKTKEIAWLIPGDRSTYTFGPEDEAEYNKMYQNALFAHTTKKGGWDCLRHYEILANGCIPLYKNLENCPSLTLTTFPKTLLLEARDRLIPWNYDNKPLYDRYLQKILDHMRTHCSASATVQYFFHCLPKEIQEKTRNVLLVMGNCGVNYTRETFWIGMKRTIQNLGGVAVEYPRIDFLYKNYKGKKEVHNNNYK